MADQLYRRAGSAPVGLPFDAFDRAGNHWTDLTNSVDGRTACGFVEAPPLPRFNPATHTARWDAGAEVWVVEALPPPPPPTKADLVAYAASVKYTREQGGIVHGGMPVATDDRSKLLLAGARIKAEADPAYTTRWKVSPTERVTVPASLIVAMSDAVLAHVDRCFEAEADITDAIAAGVFSARAEIDAAFDEALARS